VGPGMNDDGQRGPRRYALRQWLYRGGRPNRTARFLNRLAAKQYSSGILTPGG
jgi:hypothetical protein